ncbi:MAG TPA: toxin-antitoxin system protein [Terriglobia bacterium]|nr:toxin-antitoxin system protein [Terriglobia bacterium]
MKVANRTPNVRISPRAHELLRQMAEEEQKSMQSVIDRALEGYRREKFLRAANADFEALRYNPRAWKEELRERKLWEQTLADGLAKE